MANQQPQHNRAPKGFIPDNDPRVSQFGHPAPPWLVNYADLMTELVCFFIILYALSAVLSKNIQQAKKDIDQIIKEEKLQAEVKITKEGIRLTLEEKGTDSFFEVGKAELTPKMVHIMTKIGPLLKKMPNEVLIEGHTDNIPIETEQFPSNWELSSARAHTVLHYLIDQYGIEPARISAIGYGEFRPRALNDTPENRARNRRVVFFIKNVPPKPEIASAPAKKPVLEALAPISAPQLNSDLDKTFPRSSIFEMPSIPKVSSSRGPSKDAVENK